MRAHPCSLLFPGCIYLSVFQPRGGCRRRRIVDEVHARKTLTTIQEGRRQIHDELQEPWDYARSQVTQIL